MDKSDVSNIGGDDQKYQATHKGVHMYVRWGEEIA